ncbi:hypothetical protein F2P81_003144 [Scophthalmus maximus]|uniref:Uncharacterized protein n=1 Tax=Scophthalmus maximus TaxID=52904 RepID=A0A6A4T8V2_SCOMX|nr:hypothetical protein F2P81_003144 [Scophthalmus maximus]
MVSGRATPHLKVKGFCCESKGFEPGLSRKESKTGDRAPERKASEHSRSVPTPLYDFTIRSRRIHDELLFRHRH